MVEPTAYDVSITIGGTDATIYIPHDSMSIDDYPRQVSSFRFRVENPVGFTPARNDEVIVVADSLSGTPSVFLGYIIEMKTTKFGNGISVFYECEASDRKILLQRSVLDTDVLTGSDTDILSALLSNAYPDLSSFFDFTTNATSFLNGLSLAVGNLNIMDALNDLADLTGGEFNFDPTSGADFDLMSFGGGEDITLSTESTTEPFVFLATTGEGTATPVGAFGSGGNPGQCAKWQPTSGTTNASSQFRTWFRLYTSDAAASITNIVFDYYVSSDIVASTTIRAHVNPTGAPGNITHDVTSVASNTWTTVDINADGGTALFPSTIGDTGTTDEVFIFFIIGSSFDTGVSTFDVRIDNIKIYQTPTIDSAATITSLNWGDTAPVADFNFNIDSSDEYGFDFDLSEGDFDDWNSITVVGGNSEDAVDWTYPNQDSQTHINLETAIDDIVIYKNTGSEGTPSWTLQTSGVFGTDELTSVDVVYDKLNHWLYFATAPSDFFDAVRVTGTILRPIRVRVEDIGAGEQVYATVLENSSITSIDQAVALGDNKLSERNAVKSLTFKTNNPGLKPGQSISVTDTTRGLAETMVIQRIGTRWLGGALAEFTIECGTDEVVGVDTIIANNDRRSRDNQLAAGATLVTASFYTDDSDVVMTDDGNDRLYETI